MKWPFFYQLCQCQMSSYIQSNLNLPFKLKTFPCFLTLLAKVQNSLNLNSSLNYAISCLSLVLSLTSSCFKLCFLAPHNSWEFYRSHIIYLLLHLLCLYATSHFSSLSQSQSSFHESTQMCYLLQNPFPYMSCHFPFQLSSSSPLHIPVMALTISFCNLNFCELCSPFTAVRNQLATFFFSN